MKKEITICDRCGKEFKIPYTIRSVDLLGNVTEGIVKDKIIQPIYDIKIKNKGYQTFDLCCSCYMELEKWITRNAWISTDKELPTELDWYLGIFQEVDTGWINPVPYICSYIGSKRDCATQDFWMLKNLTDTNDVSKEYYKNLRCVAWQKLPDPYITSQRATERYEDGKNNRD